MKKLKITLLLFLSLQCFTIRAGDDPLWKLTLDSKVKWAKLTSAGVLIVSTNTALLGIDPQKQQKIWEIKAIDEIKEDDFNEVDGTSFAIYLSSNPLKSLKEQTTIIDYFTGRVIYNNLEADVAINEQTPLLGIGGILLQITQSKKAYLTLVDIESGKERWRIELPDHKTGFGLGGLKQSMRSALDAEAVTDKNGNIIFPDDKVLKSIDAKTGNVLWTNVYEKQIGRLNFSDDGSVIYMGSGRKITSLNLSDGKELWKEAIKISGEFKMFIPSKDKKMYIVTSDQLTLIEEASGKSVWKKPFEFDKPFKSLRFTDNGILIFGGGEKESMFDYVGFDGTHLWKRAYTTDRAVISFDLTSQGILFANVEEANMIDLKTGDDTIWKKRIKLKGSPVTYIDDKIALVYSDEKLYAINISDASYKMIAEDIKFDGREDVTKIDVLSNGYLLSSSQNMWLIAPDGKVIYSVYYKPASFGTAAKILGRAAQVYTTLNTLEVTQDPSAPNTYNVQRSQTGDDIVHGVGSIIANRKKSFSSQDSNFMMTRIEDGETKHIAMVKVDKLTGKETGKITLKALNPIYITDSVTGQLFVKINGATSGADFAAYKL